MQAVAKNHLRISLFRQKKAVRSGKNPLVLWALSPVVFLRTTATLTIIEFKQVSKFYGDVEALHDLSLAVEEDQVISLLGPSGCGKTTTLRLIAGVETPDTGDLWVSRKHVSGSGIWVPPEQRRIGMVFQDYALFPHLNLYKNIAFGLQHFNGKKASRVAEMLELVGLAGYEERMPHEISGGQQQRVALARALAPNPDVLLLDEPFSNLDTALRKQVRTEVRNILHDTHTTSVFVTHDQEEAFSLSDKVAVIFDGRLAQFDTPQNLYQFPASKQVASFVGEANFIKAQADGSVAQSPLGKVKLLQPAQDDVDLLIRPEMIHLLPTDEGTPVQVIWNEYYGHNQRVGLRLDDGSEIIARTDTQVAYRNGQNVRISVYAPLLAF